MSKQMARAILTDVIPRCQDWRQRYAQLHRDLGDLIDEFPELQHEIQRAGHEVTAASRKAKVKQPVGVYAEQDRGQTIPLALEAVPGDIQKDWAQVGGTNPSLSILPYVAEGNTLAGELFRIFQRRVGYVYRLERVDRFLGALR